MTCVCLRTQTDLSTGVGLLVSSLCVLHLKRCCVTTALSGGEPALSKENQGSKVREGCGGSEVSAYPALAESDIPPSLPHRAEAAATHAAQDLLVSIPFHLGGEEMHVLVSRNAAHFASQRH